METKPTNPLLWLLLAIVLAVGAMALFAAILTPSGTGYGMMGWGMGWGVLFMVVPVLFLILVLLAALGAFAPSPQYAPAVSVVSAIDVLDARYARGEISREEYLRVRSDLTKAP